MASGMFYYGTDVEVQLGDRVLVDPFFFRWFRKSLHGVVAYIPGISPLHKHLEYEDGKQWAIRLEDGTVIAAGYDPASPYGQPGKRIRYIGRGTGGELRPTEILDETWEDGEKEESEWKRQE